MYEVGFGILMEKGGSFCSMSWMGGACRWTWTFFMSILVGFRASTTYERPDMIGDALGLLVYSVLVSET
jgi:hypothetical protein